MRDNERERKHNLYHTIQNQNSRSHINIITKPRFKLLALKMKYVPVLQLICVLKTLIVLCNVSHDNNINDSLKTCIRI